MSAPVTPPNGKATANGGRPGAPAGPNDKPADGGPDAMMPDDAGSDVQTDAPQNGANARHQFRGRKGLRDVIVGAGVEAAYPIALLAARRQHDDRQVGGRRLAP